MTTANPSKDESNRPSDESTTDTARVERMQTQMLSRRTFIAGAGAAIAASGTAAAAETTTTDGPDWTSGHASLNFDSDYVPNPWFAESTLTRSRHKLKWGTDDAALATYVDDSDEKTALGGYVPREDTENVLTVSADKFAAPDLYDFPRDTLYDKDGDGDKEEPVRALDASHWTTTSGTNSSISVTDADLDVPHALTVDATVATGESATATFDLTQFSAAITDSIAKRYLAGVANLTLNSGTIIKVVAIDNDGDEKEVKADPAGDATTAGTFATGSGDGIVFQQRLGDLATGGSGDGSFDTIDTIEIRVIEANGTITLSAFNAEKMSEWVFGSYLKNEDTDSEERVKRVRPGPGTFTLTDFGTLSTALKHDDAVVYDVEHPFRYTLADGTGDFEYRFVKAEDYSGYEWRLQTRGKREIPSGYDLQHTGITWNDEVTAPANRYVDVWTASGVEDTDFADIEDSSKTSHAGKYDSRGATVELKASASANTVYGVGFDLLLTAANKDDAMNTSGGGGGGAPPEQQSGGSGLIATIIAIFGGGGIAVFLRKFLG